jgi:hypothetical protein
MTGRKHFSDVSLIVRECGERTADVCVRRIHELLGETPHRISARPFSATLRQSLELGARLARPWTLCIDADVLVLPGLIEFIEQVRDIPENIFEAQALVIDKLIPMRRPAGNHIYRTNLIDLALPLIPTANSLRPESDMILAMQESGHPAWQARTIIGVHDFEQNYEDIYKKAFLHGHKHDYLMSRIRPIWEALRRNDSDFAMALLALEDAARHGVTPDISRSYMDSESRIAAQQLGLHPKARLEHVSDSELLEMTQYCNVLEGEARRLADGLQFDVDAAMFPAADSTSSPTPANWIDICNATFRRALQMFSAIVKR